jgi:peptide/nickel transport system permease protein
MTAYIIRRLVTALIILLLVTIVIFLAMRLLPGDPITLYLTANQVEGTSLEQIAFLRHQYGIDKPLTAQYFDWISGVLRGDFGVSILNRYNVLSEIKARIPITAHLGSLAFVIGLVFGILAGVICAVRRGTWLDTVVTIFANIGITVPTFWLGIVLMYIFALQLKILPIFGYTSPFTDFWLSTKQLILPVICLSIWPIASTARQTRSSMLEVMRQDYIRTAWSKGLRERTIIIRHALKNALIPVVTLVGMGITQIIGGSVLIETVFNIPGMGRLMVTSILAQDYPITQGVTLLVACLVILANLVVDISYGWIDPRIRLG